MTDRELLEAAAKAAGYSIEIDMNWGTGGIPFFRLAGEKWDPLRDDGDALRLLARLRLDLDYRAGFVGVHDAAGRYIGQCPHNDDAPHDPAATRRAIVRAAAALAGGSNV